MATPTPGSRATERENPAAIARPAFTGTAPAGYTTDIRETGRLRAGSVTALVMATHTLVAKRHREAATAPARTGTRADAAE